MSPNAPQSVGFRYKKTSELEWQNVLYTEGIASSNGSFSVTIDNLSPDTTYDFEAYMSVWTGSGYQEISKSGQFTTKPSGGVATGWLELPAYSGNEDLILTMYKTGGTSGSDAERNYTFNYSKTYYAALWTAYTLTEADVVTGNSGSTNWMYNNAVFNGNYQVGVTQSGGSYPSNYLNAGNYSRGHQIPKADRTSTATAMTQTYYVTNQTPQIQNKFNASIWGSLEKAGRGFVVTSSHSGSENYNGSFTKTDVLYVITGPSYGKKGTTETPAYLTASNSTIEPQSLPIPKYFWKVFLKVKKDSSGNITGAKAIGFWFEHREYDSSTESYTDFAYSVDQIEAWTGFDLFTNLPGTESTGIEKNAESNTSWDDFRSF